MSIDVLVLAIIVVFIQLIVQMYLINKIRKISILNNIESLKYEAKKDERKRLSKEIHDEISPYITILNIASNHLLNTIDREETEKSINVIVRNSNHLSKQLNEIIWSLNYVNDFLGDLVTYIFNYSNFFTNEVGWKLEFEKKIDNEKIPIEGYTRHLIFLSVKEILNNAVKYSESKKLSLKIEEENNILQIEVKDFGKGFLDQNIENNGNGLKNINSHMEKINGKVQFINMNGLTVILTITI